MYRQLLIRYENEFYSLKKKLGIKIKSKYVAGARGNAVGWGTLLQAGRSRVLFPLRSLNF
jgi:hypothetical protein